MRSFQDVVQGGPPVKAPKGVQLYKWTQPAVYFLYDSRRIWRIGQSERLPERVEELRRKREKALKTAQFFGRGVPPKHSWDRVAKLVPPLGVGLTALEHAMIKFYGPIANGNRICNTPPRDVERAAARRVGLML